MEIKKLSVAAAISFGMFAVSVPTAMADAGCPTGQACPICPPQPQCAMPACPVEQCDPCARNVSTFLLPTQAHYSPLGQLPEEGCPIAGAACEIEGPYTATCPNYGEVEYPERQVYAYPSYSGDDVIYPKYGNQAMGFGGTGISMANQGYLPMTGAASPYGLSTGGAAPLGMIGSAAPLGVNNPMTGTQIQRTENMQSSPFTIESPSSLKVLKTVVDPIPCETGAACPLPQQFCDVSMNLWASDDINRLAMAGIVSGYPDNTFKPCDPVSRAEFAAMVVKGLNLECTPDFCEQVFCDVPANHWANAAIDKAYNKGLISGYPNNMFKPNQPVTKAEALTILSKAIQCNVSCEQAQCILSKFQDGMQVPQWGTIPVATALDTGLISDFPNNCMIEPCQEASRAEIAAMLTNLREAIALDPTAQPQEAGAAAEISQEIVTVPALRVKFEDRITARLSHIGDKFKAHTIENVTINGILFPAGSAVYGEVVQVVRPTRDDEGGLKVVFQEIEYEDLHANLPQEIITAQVEKTIKPNFVVRLLEMPFALTGGLIGVAGRTVGSTAVVAGNIVEDIMKGYGNSLGELVNGKFMASGRSFVNSTVDIITSPFDIGKVALSGTAGLLNTTIDEVAYLTGMDGNKITSIHPNEQVAVAFGCTACPIEECYECCPCDPSPACPVCPTEPQCPQQCPTCQ